MLTILHSFSATKNTLFPLFLKNFPNYYKTRDIALLPHFVVFEGPYYTKNDFAKMILFLGPFDTKSVFHLKRKSVFVKMCFYFWADLHQQIHYL